MREQSKAMSDDQPPELGGKQPGRPPAPLHDGDEGCMRIVREVFK